MTDKSEALLNEYHNVIGIYWCKSMADPSDKTIFEYLKLIQQSRRALVTRIEELEHAANIPHTPKG